MKTSPEVSLKHVTTFFQEFKAFAARGNVIDLAVGVIIGAAFGKVVDALVKNILMPPLSLVTGEIDLSNRFINLSSHPYATLEDAVKAKAPVITYGAFLDAIITFLIVSFAIFMMVRTINRLQKAPVPPAPDKKDCPFCISAIPIKATRCPQCTSQL